MSAQRNLMDSYSWLHDDTEEDLVGADWHQEAIRATVISLRDLARRRRWSWHVGDQLTLVGAKPDGTAWSPCSDVMVHPHAGAAKRKEMTVSRDGVPALVVEVVSPSTWQYDADAQRGKAFGYLAMAVHNYLLFDPHGDLLGESCRGWQQGDGAGRAWHPGPDGRYHTTSLGISLQPEGDLLRVYDPAGQPVPFYFENVDRVAELEAELARLRGSRSSE